MIFITDVRRFGTKVVMELSETMIAMIGAGGHADSVYGCLSQKQLAGLSHIVGKITCQNSALSHLMVYETDASILSACAVSTFVNGIGANPKTHLRKKIYEMYKSHGYQCETIISNMAHIHEDTRLLEGAQIFAGATLNIKASIGQNTIINTGAVIEHGVVVEEHCHIGPGAIILGDAIIRSGTFIGAGSVVLPHIEVGKNSIVGALVKVDKNLSQDSFVRA